jgi:hypothetical protein
MVTEGSLSSALLTLLRAILGLAAEVPLSLLGCVYSPLSYLTGFSIRYGTLTRHRDPDQLSLLLGSTT